MSVITITPPAVLSVSVEQLIAHLRLDDDEDAEALTDIILSAEAMFEKETNRSIMARTLRLTLDRFPSGTCPVGRSVELPRPPLIGVTSILYDDEDEVEQTLAGSVYRVQTGCIPGRVGLASSQSWPCTASVLGAVRITYTAGYQTPQAVPFDIRRAILLLAGHFYEHREATALGAGAAAEIPMGARRVMDLWHMPEFV